MFVDVSTVRSGNKTYTRYLLRESFRDNGKVKHRTVANLSQCSPAEIEAIRLALSHKGSLTNLGSVENAVQLSQGKSIGALALLHGLAQEIGVTDALGSRREGKLALWQIIARVIDHGSRLSAVRLARQQAALEILQTEPFDEDDLYKNLGWLCEKQEEIEQALFPQHARDSETGLFLYDVTSSYLEGEHNAFAAFGYNRDGKKGKRQIVVGLLCDAQGTPLAIEVFEGNTQDQKTLLSQVKKVAARFGGGDVTFVGDRGMIKAQQIEGISEKGFHYITAITKPQIEKLITQGAIQIGMFDDELAEINDEAGIRYVLRRNPLRADEIASTRQQKYQTLLSLLIQKNEFLRVHPRAKPATAFRKIMAKAHRLGIQAWVTITQNDRLLSLSQNVDVLTELSDLDGCYVLKTDLPATVSKAIVHQRYKDLAQVECAFRTMKTTHLEMRPVFVRSASHTRGHALVVMLAYRLVKVLAERWRALDLTVEEGIELLSTLCLTQVKINDRVPYNEIPQPSPQIKELFDAAQIRILSALPGNPQKVDTKTKLQNRRKQK